MTATTLDRPAKFNAHQLARRALGDLDAASGPRCARRDHDATRGRYERFIDRAIAGELFDDDARQDLRDAMSALGIGRDQFMADLVTINSFRATRNVKTRSDEWHRKNIETLRKAAQATLVAAPRGHFKRQWPREVIEAQHAASRDRAHRRWLVEVAGRFPHIIGGVANG